MLRRTTVMALSACLLVVVVAPLGTWAREGKPTKVEIGKRGKAATAFVEVPGRGSGTAFSVHPSGLFITNEQVVRGAGCKASCRSAVELAVFHDGEQVVAVEQHFRIGERVACDQ